MMKNAIDTINKKHDILIIDNDLPTIRLISEYFMSKGFTCQGILSRFKRVEELLHWTPKVILIDIYPPLFSGYDLCRKIKANKRFKHVPIFFTTTLPKIEIEHNIKGTGADGYVLKPFDFKDFAIILQYLRNVDSP